ncbi:hypothetical protein [Culicoidibacter larvae]|uniref:Uncharacterized protein n=1 Tax=Culicoidibacter larvae TaxID=2579976 RepID=A0A5R8QBC4_9FIRM|nr:hypothetical protein [Culicoidibacter larvae]TLG73812.1 hypothetical protein FEZ08_06675 [Culicoidibacter larvae]
MNKSKSVIFFVCALIVFAIGIYRWQTDSQTALLILVLAVLGAGYAVFQFFATPHDAAEILADGVKVIGFPEIAWEDIRELDYVENYISPLRANQMVTFLSLTISDAYKASLTDHQTRLLKQNHHQYECDLAIFAVKKTRLGDAYDQIEAHMAVKY